MQDLPPDAHRTAFLTHSADMPLADVLQLFSVSRRTYQVSLFGVSSGSAPSICLGRIELSAQQVIGASAGNQQGQAAFRNLICCVDPLRIEVSPLSDSWPTGQEPPSDPPLGKIDKLLLSAVLGGNPEAANEVKGIEEQKGAEATAALSPPKPAQESSTLQRLGNFLRRK